MASSSSRWPLPATPVYRGADILILDEPTAVLTPQEIDELMQIMKNL